MSELRHEEVKGLAQCYLLMNEELGLESRQFAFRASLSINILCYLFAVGKLENIIINSFQKRRFMLFDFLLYRSKEGSQ